MKTFKEFINEEEIVHNESLWRQKFHQEIDNIVSVSKKVKEEEIQIEHFLDKLEKLGIKEYKIYSRSKMAKVLHALGEVKDVAEAATLLYAMFNGGISIMGIASLLEKVLENILI